MHHYARHGQRTHCYCWWLQYIKGMYGSGDITDLTDQTWICSMTMTQIPNDNGPSIHGNIFTGKNTVKSMNCGLLGQTFFPVKIKSMVSCSNSHLYGIEHWEFTVCMLVETKKKVVPRVLNYDSAKFFPVKFVFFRPKCKHFDPAKIFLYTVFLSLHICVVTSKQRTNVHFYQVWTMHYVSPTHNVSVSVATILASCKPRLVW